MDVPKRVEWVGGTRIDTSAWPAVHIVFPAEQSEDDLRTTLERFRRLTELARGGPRFIPIVELPSGMHAPARHRKISADWLASLTEAEAATVLCSVLVIQSAIVRGFVTAVTWLARPAIELVTVETIDVGFARARSRLEQDGTVTSPLLRARAS